jgi:hypothetical protein
LTIDERRVFQSGIEDGELGKLGKLFRDWARSSLRQFATFDDCDQLRTLEPDSGQRLEARLPGAGE